MKKQLSYRNVFQRENLIKKGIFNLFLSLASYPRLTLEILIRKNFGERYFSLASGITVGVILAIIPVLLKDIGAFMFRNQFAEGYYHEYGFWTRYTTWYLFLIIFSYSLYLRWKESRRKPGVFNFEKYSLYMGKINPVFYNIELFGRKATTRKIEIFYEPALFFFAGLLLKICGQPVGLLFIICSIFYSISYAAAYKFGDDFTLDKIDQMIQNEKLHDAFVAEDDHSNEHGYRWYGDRPSNKDQREKLYKTMFEDDDSAIVI